MNSITIHGLDDSLASLLRAKARAEGTSLNKTIKGLLEQALGITRPPSGERAHFQKFCGKWSKDQVAEFERNIADLNAVEPADWE